MFVFWDVRKSSFRARNGSIWLATGSYFVRTEPYPSRSFLYTSWTPKPTKNKKWSCIRNPGWGRAGIILSLISANGYIWSLSTIFDLYECRVLCKLLLAHDLIKCIVACNLPVFAQTMHQLRQNAGNMSSRHMPIVGATHLGQFRLTFKLF